MNNRDYILRHFSFALPTVYENSLSEYELVCKLYRSFEEFVTAVDKAIDDFDSNSKEYTDNAVAEAGKRFEQMAQELDTNYRQFVQLVDNNIAALQKEFNDTKLYLDDAIIGVNARTDTVIAQNNEYIFDTISSELINIKVINYFTGEKVTIQEMFDYLAQFHLQDAISVDELISRNKTYDQLAAYKMTYTQLATNGGSIII